MKVRGSEAPIGRYSIEAVPGKTLDLVRLYQNPHEYTDTRGEGEPETGWEWDEYHVYQIPWDGLAENVEANYDVFLEAGKAAEIDKSNAALYTAQQSTNTFVYADQYMRWDGLKWIFDPENPIPLLRLPFPHGVPNAFYRYVDGKRYVYVKAEAGEITEENWNDVMERWDSE